MHILASMYIFSGTSNSTLLVCQCMSPLLQPGGCTTLLITAPRLQRWLVQGSGASSHPHIQPTLLELVWLRAGRGMCPGLSFSWSSQVSLDPKRSKPTFQTKNPTLAADGKLHRSTQPFPALFSLGFRSNLQPTIFVTMLVKGPSHQAGDTRGTVLMGTGSSTGHCRKLADGHRSLPAR